jgi:hypothetical protein
MKIENLKVFFSHFYNSKFEGFEDLATMTIIYRKTEKNISNEN